MGVLDDLIGKASTRQKAENSRFYKQVGEVKTMSGEIENDRQTCVRQIETIERHLGIVTDPVEVDNNNNLYSNGY